MRFLLGLGWAIGLILSGPSVAQDAPATAGQAAQEPHAANVQSPVIPTSAFAARSKIRDVTLSPNGKMIAMWVINERDVYLTTIELDTMRLVDNIHLGDKVTIDWLRWAGNRRLLMSIAQIDETGQEERRFTRVFVADLDTKDLSYLGLKGQTDDGDDVIHVDEDGEFVLISMRKTRYEYPAVYRLSLDDPSAKPEKVQKAKDGVFIWSTDNRGIVRMGLGYSMRRIRVWYRSSAEEKFKQIARFRPDDDEEELWNVLRIVEGSDVGYILDEDESGRIGLYKVDYSTREKLETVYSNPDWDLTAATIDRDGVPKAAYYTDDRDQIVYFQDDDANLQQRLERALPEERVRIMERSKDGTRMLVWAGSEASPGTLYSYTPEQKQLKLLAEYRPQLKSATLAAPSPHDIVARDGTKMRAYLTLPPGREAKRLPLIILPHGGPYGVRDKLRYDDEVQLLASRGYAVLQPNFRGSSGFGKAFSELGNGQIGRGMQDDLDDAMDWAVEQGFADPARVCIVGSSYGGYAAMWGVIRNPERYRCAASFAGVADLAKQLSYDRGFFSRKGGREWAERVEGEDFDLETVSPVDQIARLIRPVLLVHGTDDSVVPFSQFKRMKAVSERYNRPVETLVIQDEGHSLSSDTNEQAWYDALLGFLAKHNPAD